MYGNRQPHFTSLGFNREKGNASKALCQHVGFRDFEELVEAFSTLQAQISQPTLGKPSSMVSGTNEGCLGQAAGAGNCVLRVFEGDGGISAAPSRKECGTRGPWFGRVLC